MGAQLFLQNLKQEEKEKLANADSCYTLQAVTPVARHTIIKKTERDKGWKRNWLLVSALWLAVTCTLIAATTAIFKYYSKGNSSTDFKTLFAIKLRETQSLRLSLATRNPYQNIAYADVYPTNTPNDSTIMTFNAFVTVNASQHTLLYKLYNDSLILEDYSFNNETSNVSQVSYSCADPKSLPPFQEMISALAHSDQIGDYVANNYKNQQLLASMETKCKSKTSTNSSLSSFTNPFAIIGFEFAGEQYLACINADGTLVSVLSEDLEIDVETYTESAHKALDNPLTTQLKQNFQLNISKPHSSHFDSSKCESHGILQLSLSKESSSHLPTTRNLRSSTMTKRRLGWSSSCKCSEAEKKRCIFLHGAGVSTDSADLLEEYPKYWGHKIHDEISCCSSIKFTQFDTVNTAWTDEKLQDKFCNALVSDKKEGMVIQDTMVITHSMANLVLALALQNEKCTLHKSSKWASIEGPMRGSPVADRLANICAMNDEDDVFFNAVSSVGHCPVKETFKHFYDEGKDLATQHGLNEVYARAQEGHAKHATGVMCGVSAVGLYSSYSAVYKSIDGLVDFDEPDHHDGLVEQSSCAGAFDIRDFGRHYEDAFYVPSINHADGTFRNGDGSWGSYRKPMKWLQCLFKQ